MNNYQVNESQAKKLILDNKDVHGGLTKEERMEYYKLFTEMKELKIIN